MLLPLLAREAFRLDRMDFAGQRVGQATRRERVERMAITLPDHDDAITLVTPQSHRRVRFAPEVLVLTIPSRHDVEDYEPEQDDDDEELEEMGISRPSTLPIPVPYGEDSDGEDDFSDESDNDDEDEESDDEDT